MAFGNHVEHIAQPASDRQIGSLAGKALSAIAVVLILCGAASLDVPTDSTLGAPGVDGIDETKLFEDSGISPSQSTSELFPARGTGNPRIAELLRIAQDELSLTTAKSKRQSRSRRGSTGGALLTLGLLYFHGIGVPTDLRRAKELFVRARILGNRTVAIPLAWCYLDGCGQAPNLLAFDKIMPSVERQSKARHTYFRYEQAKRADSAEESLGIKARKLLTRAAKEGDRFALNEFGILAVQEGRLSDAVDAFERARKKGSIASQNNTQLAQELLLSKSMGAGIDVASTKNESLNQTKGATAKLDALYAKAQKLHRSATAISDYAQVIDLYRQAATQGHAPSKTILSLILSRPSASGAIDPVWMRQTSLVNPQTAGASTIQVSGKIFERDASPLLDLIPESFQSEHSGPAKVE